MCKCETDNQSTCDRRTSFRIMCDKVRDFKRRSFKSDAIPLTRSVLRFIVMGGDFVSDIRASKTVRVATGMKLWTGPYERLACLPLMNR